MSHWKMHHRIRLVLSQDQVSYMTREYQDAVQRARRLSASREKMLTGRGNPVSLLTQDDVVIYLQWLVCHLHSVQPIHHFLRVKSHRQILSLFILSDACGALFHIKICFNRCSTMYLYVWKKRWSTRKGLWGNFAWKATGWWWAFPFIHVFCNLLEIKKK